MIVCNICGAVIVEVIPSEEEEITEEEQPKKKSNKKKAEDKQNKPPEPRRASLVVLPYKYGLNCFETKEFDLCDHCKAKLYSRIEKVKFDFVKEQEQILAAKAELEQRLLEKENSNDE